MRPMKITSHIIALSALPLLSFTLRAAESTGNAFYGDAPDEHHPWAVHDRNRPQPVRVEPGTFSSQEQPGTPPSDAVILFSGNDADIEKWEADKTTSEPTKWVVKDGTFQCVPGSGYVRTKEKFADCQLHVEWSAPSEVHGDSQGRGNSGVFLMGVLEVQVLDNYNNPTYADGFAGSLYGVNPPMANPLRKPGEWQMYDIVFRRPIYKDGVAVDPGYVTVFLNGVLVQDHTPIEGFGGHHNRSKARPFPESGPLKLQDHGNPVRYRNIWYRPLPIRTVEGGTNGALTVEAATAKKAEIASAIRADAAKLEGTAKTLRLLEALCYETDETAVKEAIAQLDTSIADVKATPADKIAEKKGEVTQFNQALQYLVHFNRIPSTAPEVDDLTKIIKDNGWSGKK
jgi:hypothetical protein